jgi:hypothetical protein
VTIILGALEDWGPVRGHRPHMAPPGPAIALYDLWLTLGDPDRALFPPILMLEITYRDTFFFVKNNILFGALYSIPLCVTYLQVCLFNSIVGLTEQLRIFFIASYIVQYILSTK